MALEKVGTFVLTDESLDADSERIVMDGVDLTRFEANPVMLYNHIRSASSWFSNTPDTRAILPIGRWENIRKQRKRIVADAYIDFDDEFAAKVGNKVRNGVLNAVSIGFRPMAWSDDPNDMVKGQTGLTITKAELWEASLVDIPSNPNAVALSVAKSLGQPEAEQKQVNLNGIFIKTFHKVSDELPSDSMTSKNQINMNLLDVAKAKVKSWFGKEVETEEEVIKALQEAELPALENSVDIDKVVADSVKSAMEDVSANIKSTVDTALESLRTEYKAAISERDATISALTDKVAEISAGQSEETEEKQEEIDELKASVTALNAKIANIQAKKSGTTPPVADPVAVQTTDPAKTPEDQLRGTVQAKVSATQIVLGDNKKMNFNRQ